MAHDKGKSVLEENSLWGGCHAFFVLASILYALTAVPLFYRYGTAALCMALAVEAYNAMHSVSSVLTTMLMAGVEQTADD